MKVKVIMALYLVFSFGIYLFGDETVNVQNPTDCLTKEEAMELRKELDLVKLKLTNNERALFQLSKNMEEKEKTIQELSRKNLIILKQGETK